MAENEERDVFRNKRWRPLVNALRGGSSLNDDVVLHEFDRCFVPSLGRASRLLKVEELITACISGDSAEVAEASNFGMSIAELIELYRKYVDEWQQLIAEPQARGIRWASWVKHVGVAA